MEELAVESSSESGNNCCFRAIEYTNENGEEKEIRIRQDTFSDVGGVIWDSALQTIHYFFKNPRKWENKNVLELGCGTGICGIALAALGANVVVTDLDYQIPLVQMNIEANRDSISGSIEAKILDWTKDKVPEDIDLLLAIDCAYYKSTIDPLINILRSSNAKEILIASEKRDIGEASESQVIFYDQIKKYFNFKSINPEDLDEIYSSDDIIMYYLLRK